MAVSADLTLVEQHNSMVEQANQLLAQVVTASDANHVVREAEVARVFARQVKLGEAAVNHATAVKLRAEIRLADIVDAGQDDGSIARPENGRPGSVRDPDTSPVRLPDLGIDRRRLGEARQLRNLAPTSSQAEKRVVEEAEQATAENRELSRARLLALAKEEVETAEADIARRTRGLPTPEQRGELDRQWANVPDKTPEQKQAVHHYWALVRACEAIVALPDDVLDWVPDYMAGRLSVLAEASCRLDGLASAWEQR